MSSAGSTGTSRGRWRTSRIRSQEWRRLFSELYGTFLLVIVAAGGGMMGQAFPNTITRTAAVVAPGLMVMGDHHVHGQGVGCAPEPGRQRRVLAARRLSVAARARLRRRAADRCVAGGAVPARGDQGLGEVRLQLSGERVLGLAGVPDGGAADDGSRERDPRHGLGCAEHRHLRRDRRRRVHRARRAVGQPDLGRVDEPGSHLRPGPRRP